MKCSLLHKLDLTDADYEMFNSYDVFMEKLWSCRSHVVVRSCPHGRQCECREGETGCSTDLVMSPNIIQHSQRREGGSFGKRHAKRRALPCAESV